MHIALFGGAFDPPHLGHQNLASTLLSNGLVDEVWFVPVHHHPFGKQLESNTHREQMLKCILAKKMKVSRLELEKEEQSYSYQTITSLAQDFPQATFSWVIGSDNLKNFHLWKEYQRLLSDFCVFVYPRVGYSFDQIYPGMIPLSQMKAVNVSSSEVRKRLRRGENAEEFLDGKVAKYIRQHFLYTEENAVDVEFL